MADKSAKEDNAPQSSAKKTSARKAAGKSAPQKTVASEKYTDPALRERIKQRIMEGDKGGNPGQWSARKAQMVAHEYEAEGGGYTSPPDESQKHLMEWGDEHWTTKDGEPAKREDGMHRYLPEKAWEELSDAEKRSTDKKKVAGSHEGKQFVANTGAAKKARKSAVGHAT